ncbi:MAG: hypothetical protein HY740_08135 [Chloroflexi bacterium]|nr:hypothetical protein [Chloroflexota bacterium]
MSEQEDLQPKLRQEAIDILHRLPSAEREALLIKCWMSHDARWFMAVAKEFGMPTTNRLNQIASHETGKVEAPGCRPRGLSTIIFWRRKFSSGFWVLIYLSIACIKSVTPSISLTSNTASPTTTHNGRASPTNTSAASLRG